MNGRRDIKFDKKAEKYDEGYVGRLYIADPRLPLPVRKALNTAPDIHRINGRVYTADEIGENFSEYGFGRVFDKTDTYAQLVCPKKL
ncbi:hypothetical protein [Ruminococcus sp.]|uniref:hypothetical protein n=1 Tax=Ruminococcus sp. TaxID=41978 RepID=UPI00260088AD|nr:hypothetical protein [Ruminococcus sp.]MBQ8967091.1 hypothetical protein [Ruminococcus sp.]